jgi:predicted glycoside hydrolase/deacetylase ChbG (UPF0249 family)
MSGPRKVIVNADDLGYTPLTSTGILTAWRDGLVTSASLMVRMSDAGSAVRQARELGFDDLGLHLDLGEWICRNGRWSPLYEVVALDDPQAVADECRRQLDRFRDLVGRDPTHLDSHQHVHRAEPVRSVAREIAARLGIVLRDFSSTVAYDGGFYGQYGDGKPASESITEEAIVSILERATAVVVEIGCHPGLDPNLETMYCRERQHEVEVLCGPGLRSRLAAAGFEPTTFLALGPQAAPEPAS